MSGKTTVILMAIAWVVALALTLASCKSNPGIRNPGILPDGPDAPQRFDPEHGPNWGAWPAWPNWPEPQIV